ncbi:hypothetical protein PFISCL1PPCAC_22977 [Pristionchus fissidentatus]|uniref:Carboxylic ester hydrolase n=1 Tax=Pristionchus fissidentatus TaxID=1538716 RepID=A0AAV5WMB4_9BILA|nr:hypothetical protein PFISCL1PPCAC_22977 [Pristionchus fissidentatus]
MRRLLCLLLFPSLAFSSLVETPFGEIEGFEHVTEKGIPTHVFLGVRYGQSPDVHSRFKKPEMVEKWAPFVHSAKHFGAACIPFSEVVIAEDENYSEDCLFMNIITPTLSGKDLPVFMMIHGGGYEVGSSTAYGYKRLAERVASEGIVVVTINYRLGPLGFFSLGDSVSPGNMGLFDQTLALHFLHEVLPSFGGDSSRITVSGHSAGSCSASALQFSPHSSSLFSQSFLMSGSSLSEIALSESVVEESKKLAKELGCLSGSSAKTIDCMQERTAHEIIQAVTKLGTTRRHTNILKFHPRLDGDFFPHSIERLAKTAPKKRTVQGAADQESALFVLYEEASFISGLTLSAPDQKRFSRENLVDFIETVVVTDHEHHDSASAFRRHLIEFYVEKDEKKGDSEFYLQRFSDLASDLQFLIPLYQELQIKLANNWPSYLYILQHAHKSFPRDDFPITGAYHGDELEHITDEIVLHPLKADEPEDHVFGSHFVKAVVNFVKNGDPSSSSFSWPLVSKDHPFQHASITANISLRKEAYRSAAVKLWLENVPKSVSGESLRKSRLPGAEALIVHTEL